MGRHGRRAVALAAASLAAVVWAAPGAGAEPVQPQPRIVNGTLVDAATFTTNWSFIVNIDVVIAGQQYLCGGTLVTDEVVVTAAHCMFDQAGNRAQPDGFAVGGGSIDYVNPAFFEFVSDIAVHPGYDPTHAGSQNDIALLRLIAPVAGGVAQLAAPGEVPQGGFGDAAGWGCNVVFASGPCDRDEFLRQASLPVLPGSTCDGIYGDVSAKTQLCAGTSSPLGEAPDTCQGDSGGPVVVRDGGGTRLVGVTSYGDVCGYNPGVYTGVGGYRCFLDPIINAWDPVGFPSPTECAGLGTFVPMAPQRVIDTRPGSPVTPGSTLAVPILGAFGVPSAGVEAVSLNVTAVDPQGPGYLTVFPCGQAPPLASNVNYVAFGTVANSVAVGVGGGGAVCMSSFATSDVIIDVSGYWHGAGVAEVKSRYNPIPPVRLGDSRVGNTPLLPTQTGLLPVGDLAADTIGAVTLNITVVEPVADGYLTAYPCDSPVPATSNVNYKAGQTVANAVTVAVSANEQVCLVTYARTHVIIDATGWFGVAGGTTGGKFSPVEPDRLVDTRITGIVPAGGTLPIQAAGGHGVPADAVAVVVNVTSTGSLADGYLTAFPCGGALPATSTVNYVRGANVPNLAFVPVAADGTLCINSYATSHVVVDVTGYVVP